MQSQKAMSARVLAVLLALALCGVPELAQAAQQPAASPPVADQQSTDQQPSAQSPGDQNAPETVYPTAQSPQTEVPSLSGSSVDPARGPLQPVPPSSSDQNLPEAPSASQQTAGTPQAPAVPSPNVPASEQKPPVQPVGAATAERTPTAGGAASKPAGTAIAPAKQRQVRSLLIKLGAVAGAAVALGTVMALSQKSPSTPPGAQARP